MRSTILGQGRHRLGLPGLVPVRHFVTVTQRNFLARLFGIGHRPGRHAVGPAQVLDLPVEAPALRAAAA